MSNNKYSGFFAAYNAAAKAGNPNTKEDVVAEFTSGRTSSVKDLSHFELQELTRQLNVQANSKPINDKGDKMRKSILSIFYDMKRKPADAISWAEGQGVYGIKKKFNNYTNGELFVLIRLAEKVRSDWQDALRKKLGNL